MRSINWTGFVIISIVSYSLLIIIFGFIKFKTSILSIPISWWFVSLLFTISSHFILSIRWTYLIRHLNFYISYFSSLKIYSAGLTLMATPARSAESIRGLWLNKRHQIPINIGICVTISERLSDLLSALLIISLSINGDKLIIFTLIFITIIIILTNKLHYLIKSILAFIVNLLPFTRKHIKGSAFIQEAYNSLTKLQSLNKPIPLIFSVFLCSIVWIIESLLLYITLEYLNVNLTFSQSCIIRTSMGIGGVISLFPGGLITSESTAIAIALAYGAGRSESIAATLFIRIYTLFLPSLIGFFSILLQNDLNYSLKNLNKPKL